MTLQAFRVSYKWEEDDELSWADTLTENGVEGAKQWIYCYIGNVWVREVTRICWDCQVPLFGDEGFLCVECARAPLSSSAKVNTNKSLLASSLLETDGGNS